MKTIKSKILVIAFMFITLIGYAKSEINFNNAVSVLEAKKVKVEFKDVKLGNKLVIRNEENVELHSEKISQKGDFSKIFDLSSLENGKYSIELHKDFEIIVESFLIDDNQVMYSEDSEKVIFKPIVRNEENLILISKISFDKEPLMVSLYYNNDLIYSETVTGDTILNRVYKLNKELKGDYRVVLYSNDKSYIHNFKI